MPKPYQQTGDTYPLLTAADDFVAFLQKLDLHGWEAQTAGSEPKMWQLRTQPSAGRLDEWAIIRRQENGIWGVSEQFLALCQKSLAPWERLRELADQLEREARAS